MKNIFIIDEFGIDITKIVDVVVKNGTISVFDEFGIDITKRVDIVIK